MARGTDCAAHNHGHLVPIEVHHIWPTCYHGPDVKSNKVRICANAHSDIHYMMEAMLKGKPLNKREYGPGVRKYATLGYEQVVAYAESLAPVG